MHPVATDADGDAITYAEAVCSAGAGITYVPGTRTFSNTGEAAGTVTCTLTAADGFATPGADSDNFDIIISTPPVIAALTDQTVIAGRPLSYDISGLITDPDTGHRAALTYSTTEVGQGDLMDWLSFTSGT